MRSRLDRASTSALGWVLAAAACCAPAAAQFYEKVDLRRAPVERLRAALSAENQAIGASVAALAGIGDPRLEPVFRGMAGGDAPPVRVFGVLGTALVTKKGIDPALWSALRSDDARATVVRDANITGILRDSDAAALLAAAATTPAATLALVGELHRRGAAWDPARIAPIASGDDPVAGAVASLLLLAGPTGGTADPAPWQGFLERAKAMAAEQRTAVMRAAIEASLLFEIKPAAAELLAACGGAGSPDALRVPAVGMALRIDTPRGLEAWRARVREERSQVALVRAGMQLLSAIDRGVPAGDFDAIRNGSPVIDAIADAGKAIASGQDEVTALIALLDAGHSASAEWALVRAAEMPPERSAPVWRHLLGKIDAGNPDERPAATIVSGVVRELVKTDPASVEALGKRVDGDDLLEAALMLGLWESNAAAAPAIARGRRGSLPRMGESLACMILARAAEPLSPEEQSILARAAVGGGDVDPTRALQAAWLSVVAAGDLAEATRALGGSAAQESQP
jgi:hypothetical protein